MIKVSIEYKMLKDDTIYVVLEDDLYNVGNWYRAGYARGQLPGRRRERRYPVRNVHKEKRGD